MEVFIGLCFGFVLLGIGVAALSLAAVVVKDIVIELRG